MAKMPTNKELGVKSTARSRKAVDLIVSEAMIRTDLMNGVIALLRVAAMKNAGCVYLASIEEPIAVKKANDALIRAGMLPETILALVRDAEARKDPDSTDGGSADLSHHKQKAKKC